MLAIVTSYKVAKGGELSTNYCGSSLLVLLYDDDNNYDDDDKNYDDDDNYYDDNKDGEDDNNYDEWNEELVDMSNYMQQLVVKTIQHNLDAMKQVQATHTNLQVNLERLFLMAKNNVGA